MLAITLTLAAVPTAQEHDRLLAAVPAEALAVVAVDRLDELRARAATNDWWKMLNGAELRPFVARLEELLDEAVDDDADTGKERKVADARAWLSAVHGAAAAYFVADGDAPGGIGLFVEPGEDAAAFDELWDALVELAGEDMQESAQEYQGVELTLLEEREEDAEDGERELTIHFDVAGVRGFVVGDRRAFVLELAQGAIDRMLGKDDAPGFGGGPAVAAARGSGGRSALECYLDPGRLAFTMGAAEEPDEEARARVREMLERTGVAAIRYAYFAADLGEGEQLDVKLGLHLPGGSWLQRASECARPAPRDLLALFPADSMQATVGAIDLGELYRFVRAAVTEFEPEGVERMDAGVKAFETMLGIGLEGELLEQILGEFGSAEVRIPPEEVPPAVAEALGPDAPAVVSAITVFVLRVEDGQWVEDLIEHILQMFGMGALVTEEEYQGHAVSFLGEDGNGMYWTCTDEYVVISQTPTPLRSVLARIGGKDLPAMLGEARYQAALAATAGAAAVTLGDTRAVTESTIRGLRLGAELSIASITSEEHAKTVRELLAELPDPAFVGKYLDGVYQSTVEVLPEAVVMRVGSR